MVMSRVARVAASVGVDGVTRWECGVDELAQLWCRASGSELRVWGLGFGGAAEDSCGQVKTLKQVGTEVRRLLEFGKGGSVEGMDCHMWKKLQNKVLAEAKGPARQLREANGLSKLLGKLMKEIIKTAKGKQPVGGGVQGWR
jgi:hypothetical protein